ncbi:MAG TPA: RDD family protein [Thermoanaerobaculia bacterium]|nr:RDD family protein [Thermoanaerobaculia bacterium]
MGSDSSSQTTLLRIAAFLVDALSISILLILPSSVISYSMAWFGGSVKAIALVWFAALGVLVLAMLLRDGYRGRSIGKRLLGLRLVTPRGEGCGWGRSVVRNVFLALFPIEAFLVLRGKPRLGDRVARTMVMEE